jgi:formylglycine-generating enzyme required for sulfatase activity
MDTITFSTPQLNEKGEILRWTEHTAIQFTQTLKHETGLEMLLIPRGSFQMGSVRHLGNSDETPQHTVIIKPFMMSKFLITQRQWKSILGKLPPCRFKEDRLPVERMSWKDAQNFCKRLSEATAREYRLPSESQWEYACRAGATTPFHYGETLTVEVANFNGEHVFRQEPRGYYRHVTTEGGTFPPNTFGLCDMHGNLWEWCEDNWMDDYSSSPRDGNSYQKRDDPFRVARGGSWHEPPGLCRSASRLRVLQSEADEVMGLRVICDAITAA